MEKKEKEQKKMMDAKEIGIMLVAVFVVIPAVVTTLFYLPQVMDDTPEDNAKALGNYIEKMVTPWWINPLTWASEAKGAFGTIMVLTLLAIMFFIYHTTGQI